MNFKINILNENIKLSDDLIKVANNDPIVAKIFYNRGFVEPEKVKEMIDINNYEPVNSNEFYGMEKAVKRVVEAIENNQKIAIYGDYDVDGVTSTVVLMSCLKRFTNNIKYHVPDRFLEGYGMNMNVIKKLKKESVELIITCDCGISNIDEIKMAGELGMDVIVTDHHNLPENLPPADVILNPKFFEKEHRARNISGCAMAYFLCSEIYKYYKLDSEKDEFLDLVVVSTIADIVPLSGENRYLLKKGLSNFLNTKRIGLKALIDVVQKSSKIETEEDIAFQIAPRINAAGRMDSARLPVEMLLSESYEKALEIANKIDELNKDRKEIQQKIFDEAKNIVEESKKEKEVLVLFSDFWHHGIIGIAAGKICETYNRPAILLSLKEDGKTIVGSARSVEDVNVYELIKRCSKYLLKFGGHSQAAGLSLCKENLNDFVKSIETIAASDFMISDEKLLDVDKELDFKDVDIGLYQRIREAGPFGEGFRPPLFSSKKVSVLSDRVTQKNHHIMVLEDEKEQRIKGVKWFGEQESYQGKVFDFVYKITKNSYKGNDEIQINSEYILNAEGEAIKAFTGEFVDYRSYKPLECLDKLKVNGVKFEVFYEGMNSGCTGLKTSTVNRSTVKKSEYLLLLSPTVNLEYLREILAYVNPKFAYINFGVLPNYKFREFILNSLKLIKHVINNCDGSILLEEFSIKLVVEENIANTLLIYLKKMGMIDYKEENGLIILNLERRLPFSDKIIYEKALRNALKEKEAYIKYIISLDFGRLSKYINGVN